jgi:carbon storage regulator
MEEEGIMIAGGSVCIRVLSIRGKRVRLGIIAPDNIDVHREEIFERIKQKDASDSK